MRRVEIHVRGLVQGVFFRDSARTEARRLGVTGWVRNRPDGRVELHARGEESAVAALIDWCRVGPPHAHVSGLEVTDLSPDESDADGFEIR